MAFQFMACRGVRSSLFGFFVIFGAASASLFSASSGRAFGQESDSKTTHTSTRERDWDRPYLRDRLDWNWNQRGRTVPRGESAAGLRFRAYRQKMAMRTERAAANANSAPSPAPSSPHPLIAKNAMSGAPAASSGSTVWAPLGPAPLASDATGDGAQDYNWVSGRATSVLIDPAGSTGNTVLLGGAYGGLWETQKDGMRTFNPGSGTVRLLPPLRRWFTTRARERSTLLSGVTACTHRPMASISRG